MLWGVEGAELLAEGVLEDAGHRAFDVHVEGALRALDGLRRLGGELGGDLERLVEQVSVADDAVGQSQLDSQSCRDALAGEDVFLCLEHAHQQPSDQLRRAGHT